MSQLLGELRPLSEDMAAPGDERAPMARDDREGAEPIMLELEDPVARVERLGNTDEWLGPPRQHTANLARARIWGTYPQSALVSPRKAAEAVILSLRFSEAPGTFGGTRRVLN